MTWLLLTAEQWAITALQGGNIFSALHHKFRYKNV